MKTILRLLPAALFTAAMPASAAVVHSGAVNVPIPFTFNGVYLNIVTGATSLSEPPDFYGSPTAAWINIDFAGVDVVNGDGLSPMLQVSDQVVNIPYSTAIDGTGTYASGPNASTNHLGSGPGQFQASVPGFIGFRMNPTGGGDQFGWIHVSLNDDSSGGTIDSYAYESSVGIPIGAGVPEPGTASAVLLAAAGLFIRKRSR